MSQRKLAAAVLASLLVSAAFGGGCSGLPSGATPGIDHAIASVYPALVRIQVVMTSPSEGRIQKMEGSGSGVIISPEGYVITNHHVAGHSARLVCRLADRQEIDATLVGTDPMADIAVLKLKLEQRCRWPRSAIPAPFAWATPCWRWAVRRVCRSPSPSAWSATPR
jgi:S1-C subfamily serine protease